jgi:3-isopropylmalate/(R)-2-methylmalate dehydratase small subunit
MEPLEKVKGIVAPLDRINVDTDQIIPKQFLKRIERTGFGEFLFFDWRFHDDGTPNPDFELNKEHLNGANILLTSHNFGSGSSREHAPWALREFGFQVIIAPSFADIFYNNCFKNAILPVVLPEDRVKELFSKTEEKKGYVLSVDLDSQTITGEDGWSATFEIDPFKKKSLLEGLDDIAHSLEHENKIEDYEKKHSTQMKWATPNPIH